MISNFLKKVRNEKSYTQDEMAKILGVSYRTYQRVEANESHLSSTYFYDL
ncbi:MAG: helix-turn-helix domain-containing protein [Bdellovibrionales bacterium]|nr:helix-turn-helix domain-containing protein [Bdellovibrionales bacterium]